MDHPDEMKYWSKHFGVTSEEPVRLVERWVTRRKELELERRAES
jgi:hypothetical protein